MSHNKVRLYWKTPAPLKISTTPAPVTQGGVVIRMMQEVLLFKSLFGVLCNLCNPLVNKRDLSLLKDIFSLFINKLVKLCYIIQIEANKRGLKMKLKQTLSFMVAILMLQACVDKKDPPRDFVLHQTATNSAVSEEYKADTSICATNVQRQFHDAVNGKLNWSTQSWSFDWNKAYEPDNATPKSIFGSPVKGFLGINVAVKHVQGFVRTNSDEFPYAGSHSHTETGGIFVVKKTDSGLSLASLHTTEGAHPSGVHILGKYLVYGENGKLVFKNLESTNQVDDIKLAINGAYGGGLGLIKLDNGQHLVISTGPGGEKNMDKKNHFFGLDFQNGSPNSLYKLNEEEVSIPSDWSRKYLLSENNSIIAECGTGDIYVVNVSGDTGVKLLSGNGYWKLSKLEFDADSNLTLTPVNYYKRGQNTKSCNSRATGTVSVSSDHKLEFYCHEHGKDKDKTYSNYSFEKGVFN